MSGFLSEEEAHALEAAALPAKSVAAGVDLVKEGAPCASPLFVITKGWACRYATTGDGGRQFPALLLPGDLGNTDSLMFERIDYGVRTLTRATVVVIPRHKAVALAAQHPGIARTFIWLALVENAILSKWALSLGRRSSRERVAHLLCELSVRLAATGDLRDTFDLLATQEQLADALGLTAVHVNRKMQQLRAEGLIATANRTVTFLDEARLRSVGEFDPGYLHLRPGEAPAALGFANTPPRRASAAFAGQQIG